MIDQSRQPEESAGLRDLLAPDVRRRTVLTTVPWFLMDIATYGVGVFTPTILAALAIAGDGTFLSDDIASTEGAVVLDLFLIVGFALAIWKIETVRHTTLQVRGFVVMAVSLLVLALASELPGGGDDHLWMVFIAYPFFNVFMNMGPNSTTFLLPAEVFPVKVRAPGPRPRRRLRQDRRRRRRAVLPHPPGRHRPRLAPHHRRLRQDPRRRGDLPPARGGTRGRRRSR